MIKPRRDYIVCEIEKEDTSGIVISRDVEDSEQCGTVVAIGPGRYESGLFVANTLEPGVKVIWNKYAEKDYSFEENGRKYTVIRESQVIAEEY